MSSITDINFFTPINYSDTEDAKASPAEYGLYSIADEYFFFGGTVITAKDTEDLKMLQVSESQETRSFASTALKVFSYVIFIIPLIALAVKCVSRYLSTKTIENLKSSDDVEVKSDQTLFFEKLCPTKAKQLAIELETLLKGQFIGHYRNSTHVLDNMVKALKKFAETQDLSSKINVTNARGMGATLQPDTVEETFLNALDSTQHGGIKQTIASMSTAKKDQEMDIANKAQEIVDFLTNDDG